MNELHKVMVQTVQVGGKDINLKIEEEYAPGNMDQPIAVRVIGPNDLQSTSVDGMLKLLEVAPRYLLSEESGERSAPTTSSGTASTGPLSAGDATPLPETASSRISKDVFDSKENSFTVKQTGDEWPSYVRATVKHRRFVRVGKQDVEISECWYWPQKDEQGRHWFQTANGMKTATYGEMCKKLGGRPRPRLPEDEDRPNQAVDDSSLALAGASIPLSGTSGLMEDAFDLGDASGDAKCSERRRDWEPFDPAQAVQTDPWTLDERSLEELSEDELTMRMIWDVEQIKQSDPELYEAALDSGKRQAYLDQVEREEQLAADLAPRCQYIKADGEPCGSPALKKRRYCYFHIRTSEERKKTKEVQLPVLEDDLAIQMAVTNVCRGLLKGSLEPKCASTLLYGLQVASVAVRKVGVARARDRE